MEALLFILIVVILILLIILKNDVSSKLNIVQSKIELLLDEIKKSQSTKEFKEQKEETIVPFSFGVVQRKWAAHQQT